MARSDRAVILVETDAPPRYFLQRAHVTADLRRSETVTSPYLGVASHWSMAVAGERRDVAVSYDAPRPDVAVLEPLIAFDEQVAEIHVSTPPLEGNDDGTTG